MVRLAGAVGAGYVYCHLVERRYLNSRRSPSPVKLVLLAPPLPAAVVGDVAS